MRKFLLFICALGAISSSCTSEKEQTPEGVKGLIIRINSVTPDTRAVEAPGSSVGGTIRLSDGIVFVATPGGALTHRIPLVVSNATSSAGQNLGLVAANSSVLVVGNIGAAQTDLNACATIAEVLAVAANIEFQTDYQKVALSSSSQSIGSAGANGVVRLNVNVSPVISRLELMQVKSLTAAEELAKAQLEAAANGEPVPTTAAYVTGYRVGGVYVDHYYPQFTFGGANKGIYHQQGIEVDFTGIMDRMKDEGQWLATGAPLIATPGTGNAWAYNVASSGVIPRLIIKLTNITYTDDAGATQTITEPRYLTIANYKYGATPIDAFVRGRIYRIGGNNGLSFGFDDMTPTPNPDAEELYLHVGVTIVEWIIETPDGDLQ